MQETVLRRKDLIFALDIGTHSVIGVVGVPEGEGLRVLYVESLAYGRRVVVDGQIEDIGQTARVAAIVKERLEAKLGFPLLEVHVAAAGRVLKTKRVTWEMPIDSTRPIDAKLLSTLESQAIQSTYEELMRETAAEQEGLSLYCVGHSVIRYMLDGYNFSTLTGHRGRRAGVELVATFLPNEVVESLYATMRRIGLTTASVTLEPIAAINAVVPQELRLLNVVLVDVGAGTSDIAIAQEGSVSAYTMATVAGDEITEQIMKELLVDFQTAEQIKHHIGEENKIIQYEDILGNREEVGSDSLFRRVLPTIEGLAQVISQRILDANGGPPAAVFVVGGGSRTPTLCTLIARYLGIEENKVAVGGNNYMRRLLLSDPQYASAEYATPMGIALTAMGQVELESTTITLNGSPVTMGGSEATTVMELLLRTGYQYSQIMGRSGKSLTYELGGRRVMVRGELPTLASVLVNGKVANVTTPLRSGDSVEFVPAVNGRDVDCRIENLLEPWDPFRIFVNGVAQSAGTIAWINGGLAEEGQLVEQMDKVEASQVFSLGDFLAFKGYAVGCDKAVVNGRPGTPDMLLSPGDRVELLLEEGEAPPAPEEEPAAAAPGEREPLSPAERAELEELLQGTEVLGAAAPPQPPESSRPTKPAGDVREEMLWEVTLREEAPPETYVRAEDPQDIAPRETPPQEEPPAETAPEPAREAPPSAKTIRVILNGQPVAIKPGDGEGECYFFDVLNFMDIDPAKPKGEIVIRKNGLSASYVEAIRDGDEIEIFWGS